jgi:ribosome-associated translation inhibitor RaiA
VTATRFYQHKRYQTYVMRMTVTVREKDNERIAVRVNARVQEEAVTRPETYQDFFAALDKSMFLTLHKID